MTFGVALRVAARCARPALIQGRFAPVSKGFGASAFRAFSDVKFAKTHEWLRMEGDTAVLGISDFAQGQLGEVVYCDLPSEGSTFTAKDTICTLESVKAVGEVYAPVDCEVVEVNDKLADEPALVNSSCDVDGWLVKASQGPPRTLQGHPTLAIL